MGCRLYCKCHCVCGGKHRRLGWVGGVWDPEGPTAHLKAKYSLEVEEAQADKNQGERKAFSSEELIVD